MPEIAEGQFVHLISIIQVLTHQAVARITHFLRAHLVGKQIAHASAIEDVNVFGKVGTTGAEVEAALRGKKVC